MRKKILFSLTAISCITLPIAIAQINNIKNSNKNNTNSNNISNESKNINLIRDKNIPQIGIEASKNKNIINGINEVENRGFNDFKKDENDLKKLNLKNKTEKFMIQNLREKYGIKNIKKKDSSHTYPEISYSEPISFFNKKVSGKDHVSTKMQAFKPDIAKIYGSNKTVYEQYSLAHIDNFNILRKYIRDIFDKSLWNALSKAQTTDGKELKKSILKELNLHGKEKLKKMFFSAHALLNREDMRNVMIILLGHTDKIFNEGFDGNDFKFLLITLSSFYDEYYKEWDENLEEKDRKINFSSFIKYTKNDHFAKIFATAQTNNNFARKALEIVLKVVNNIKIFGLDISYYDDAGLNDFRFQMENNARVMTKIAKSGSRNYHNGVVGKSVDGGFSFPELYISTQGDGAPYTFLSPGLSYNFKNKIAYKKFNDPYA